MTRVWVRTAASYWRWLPFLLCAAALAYGVFRRQPPPEFFLQSDKVLHVLAFTGLALCTRLAIYSAPVRWVVLGLLCAAVGTEYLQHWVQPLRMFSFYDAASNMVGVMLGLLCWAVLMQTALGARLVRVAYGTLRRL